MGYLRISCKQCGGAWEIYSNGNYYDEDARTCPHCFAEINKQTWHNQVVPAFGSFLDANRELSNDNSGYSEPLFKVEYLEPEENPSSSVMNEQLDNIERGLVAILSVLTA